MAAPILGANDELLGSLAIALPMERFTKDKEELFRQYIMDIGDYVREEEEDMCNLSQGFVDIGRREGRKEGRALGLNEGRAEGREETRRETALRMLADGLNIQKVSEYSGLSISSVENLANEA